MRVKYSLFVLMLCLAACKSREEYDTIEGEPVEGEVKAYEEMCQREPESILCKDKK